MKYKLTQETIKLYRMTLYRIECTESFSDVKVGDKGGFVESEDNLSQEGNAWIYDQAKVFDDACVYDNAQIHDQAEICGDALVYGNAKVSGNAVICDEAEVYGNAEISDHAYLYNKADIGGNTKVCGKTEIR